MADRDADRSGDGAVAETVPPEHDGIRFDDVSKWFRGEGDSEATHALSHLDLHVRPGEFVSLIGPSGCGKSTALRLAGGLLAADRGTVTIAGIDPEIARREKQYGFVPQTPALLPWKNVADNTALLTRVNRSGHDVGLGHDDQLALLHQIGLGPFLDAFPHELSGGLQQRVAIARAFALDAPVMLMDEPFSALDEITRSDMRYLLLDVWRQRRSTVLFVTHSVPEAVILSDRVVVLSGRPGRVVDVVDVPLARPRHEAFEDDDVFHAAVTRVRTALRTGWSR